MKREELGQEHCRMRKSKCKGSEAEQSLGQLRNRNKSFIISDQGGKVNKEKRKEKIT